MFPAITKITQCLFATFHKCLPPTYLYPVYLINATDMLYPVQTLCFRMRPTLWRLS